MDAKDGSSGSNSRHSSRPASIANGNIGAHPKVVSFRHDSHSRRSHSLDSRRGSKTLGNGKENEYSPSLPPSGSEEVEERLPGLSAVSSPNQSEEWDDDMSQETKSSWYLLLSTLAIGGSQIAWSVESSNGSPYLLGLGISKSLSAFVWIAGPSSGTSVQPYVGIKSDRSRSKWGKRRPFIIGGAIATMVSLVCLAWARDIVAGFSSIFGVHQDAKAVSIVAIVFAVFFIYVLDFSINVVQAAIRAFIVDNAPTHQQNEANAWASRWSGIGNILGYLSGYVNLPRIMPFFGNTQFKVSCVIACFALAITVTISCGTIKERDARLEGKPTPQDQGLLAFFRNSYHSMRRLPPQIKRVCMVQFFAWIGWFPFLFYITTYVGEIYVEPYFAENPHMTPKEIDATWEHATRIGTFALLVFAITTFASSVFSPLLVQPTFRAPMPPPRTPLTPNTQATTPGSMSGSGYFSYQPNASTISISSNRKKSLYKRIQHALPSTVIPGFTSRRAWLLSHILFASATWMTFVVRTTTGATILVGFIGVPWASSGWAPFAIISAEISKREAIRRGQSRAPLTRDGELLASGEDPSEGADQAGVVLGIHNVAIAAPQVIATSVSSAIFKALQKPRGSVGDNSVAWVLRFGGCAAIVAAWLTSKIQEQPEEGDSP